MRDLLQLWRAFFNRVPKTGSEMFVKVLFALAKENDFVHKRFPSPQPRKLEKIKQVCNGLITSLPLTPNDIQLLYIFKCGNDTHIWWQTSVRLRLSYDRHVYFVNFTEYTVGDELHPCWFSIVRDPVEKYISRFNYLRKSKFKEGLDSNLNPINTTDITAFVKKDLEKCIIGGDVECTFFLGQSYDLTIPYFCGQDDECQILGSSWALQRAKENVEKYYPVVGVLEELPVTMKLLERVLPTFFQGIEAAYFNHLNGSHFNRNGKKQKASQIAREILATNLTAEYDFYHFVKSRLQQQYSSWISKL